MAPFCYSLRRYFLLLAHLLLSCAFIKPAFLHRRRQLPCHLLFALRCGMVSGARTRQFQQAFHLVELLVYVQPVILLSAAGLRWWATAAFTVLPRRISTTQLCCAISVHVNSNTLRRC